jgi:hypothetical protein
MLVLVPKWLFGVSALSFNAVPVDIIDRRVSIRVVERIVIEDIGAVAVGKAG